jgi:hypothetical protein
MYVVHILYSNRVEMLSEWVVTASLMHAVQSCTTLSAISDETTLRQPWDP